MGGSGGGVGDVPFVGRRAELALLRDRLAAAVRNEPAVVQVEGPPGIGKTALVDRFLAKATEITDAGPAGRAPRVLRVSGDESETLLPYGVVEQLARVAGPAGAPLTVADDLATPDGVPLDDPVTVGTRILRVLDVLGRDGPLILVIDDAHWADLPSLRALIFALRRMVADQLLALVVTRDDAVPLLPGGLRRLVTGHRGTVLRLAGLGEDELRDLAALLGVEGAGPTVRAARTLREATGGSPLHARALLEEFPARRWTGREPLPAPRSFRVLVAERCRGAAPATLALVEAAAVLGSGAELAAAARLGGVADPLAALDEAVKLDLLVPGDVGDRWPVSFPHPLVRAAVHDGLGPARRAALHLAAARLAEAEGDAVGVLRHRVAAAAGPDAALAADLADLARQEAQKHAWPAAAAHLVQAARLDPDRARAQERLLGGVNWMLLTGDIAQAQTFAAEVAAFPPGPLRDSVLGFLARAHGDPVAAEGLLRSAWERCRAADGQAEVAPDVAATIALQNAVHRYGRLDGAGDGRVVPPRAVPGRPRNREPPGRTDLPRVRPGLHGRGRGGATPRSGERWSGPASRLLRGCSRGPHGVCCAWSTTTSTAPGTTWGRRRRAPSRSVSSTASYCFAYLARADYFAGAWDDAVVHAERAAALAEEADLDFTVAMALAVAALVPAARGDHDTADALLRVRDAAARLRALDRARSGWRGRGWPTPTVTPAACSPRWSRCRDLPYRDAVDEPGFWAWHDLYADALVALGRVEEADAFLVPHEERAADSDRAAPIARLARARGRVEAAAGRPEAAEEAFDRALEAMDGVALPFERAQVELAAGAVPPPRRAPQARRRPPGERAPRLRRARRRPCARALRPRAGRVRTAPGGPRRRYRAGTDVAGAGRGPARRRRTQQPGDRRGARGQREDHRVPPAQRLPEARRGVAARARRDGSRRSTTG